MLLRFSVTNHLSFRDRQEFSLLASSLKDPEMGLLDGSELGDRQILPAAVVYGANASGKSNFVDAISYMREQIRSSHIWGRPESGLERRTFALDPTYARAPSKFDIDFLSDGVRYHYGFETSDKGYTSEWLYGFPRGSRQMLFEREYDRFRFGRNLKGRNKVISDLTRDNSLFVSAALQNDHKQITEITKFFRFMRSNNNISVGGSRASLELADKEIDNRTIEFLGKIGTGVTGFRWEESEYPDEYRAFHTALQSAMKEVGKGELAETFPPPEELGKNKTIELAHKGPDGSQVYMSIDRESAGTRRLLVLLGSVFRVLDRGGLLLIDELDASLHTQACEAVLALFSHAKTNPHGAQMIATTHDTNLLASPLLRRDQVWFAEKDFEGMTYLYPLTDIRTRKDDNIERGYLQGRFGAIPFAGSVTEIFQVD